MARADFGGKEIPGMAKLSKKLHVCRLHLVSSPILLMLYDVARWGAHSRHCSVSQESCKVCDAFCCGGFRFAVYPKPKRVLRPMQPFTCSRASRLKMQDSMAYGVPTKKDGMKAYVHNLKSALTSAAYVWMCLRVCALHTHI